MHRAAVCVLSRMGALLGDLLARSAGTAPALVPVPVRSVWHPGRTEM
jgi:hypothetical protein